MKRQVALTAASLLTLSISANASSGYVALFDFGDLHGSGWSITSQTGHAEVYTPGGEIYGIASGSGPGFTATAGPTHGGSASVDAGELFSPNQFMRLSDAPSGVTPGTSVVTFADYVATITIAPGATFGGSPLVNLGFSDSNKLDDVATTFARATVSISVDTGTKVISNSQSIYQDASSPLPYLMTDSIFAGLTNTSSQPWMSTFTISAQIWAHAPIPEPADPAMMAAGLAVVGFLARRRKR